MEALMMFNEKSMSDPVSSAGVREGCVACISRPLSRREGVHSHKGEQGPVLTLTAFPHPCLALWSHKGLEAGCFVPPHTWDEKRDGCEAVLPRLWRAFQDINPRAAFPACVATFQGPGPYTRLRSGRAFAGGLALGWSVPCIERSFFHVFGMHASRTMAIHTGIDQWIPCEGPNLFTHPPVDWHVIASHLYDQEQTLDLMERLFLSTLDI